MGYESVSTLGVTDHDLVTGEAVALDLPPASVGLRIISGLLDVLALQALLIPAVLLGAALATPLDEAGQSAVLLLCVVAVLVGVPVTCETRSRGRTLGKLTVGLRAVRDDGGPITFRHALTRGLVAVVEVYLLWGLPALVSCLVTPQGKRVGDIAAGTYVVRDRVQVTLPPPVPMPPHLAPWAQSADVSTLPDVLSSTVRSFLPAAFTMAPGAREQLGRELLDETLRYVSPPPPPGNHPEYVLAAVVAERRRRDTQRLLRDAALRDRLVPADPLD